MSDLHSGIFQQWCLPSKYRITWLWESSPAQYPFPNRMKTSIYSFPRCKCQQDRQKQLNNVKNVLYIHCTRSSFGMFSSLSQGYSSATAEEHYSFLKPFRMTLLLWNDEHTKEFHYLFVRGREVLHIGDSGLNDETDAQTAQTCL